MYLKQFIFAFSCLVIFFALSLYFQTGEEMNKTNWESFDKQQQEGDRVHQVAQVNQALNPFTLEEIIEERIAANRLLRDKTRVMEIGAGNGLAVMELKKKFPEVEFYVINKRKNHTIYRRENIGGSALAAGIFTPEELKEIELPYLLFRDLDYGTAIPYGNERFDLIYSYNMLSNIKYKFELLSETLRVLKKGGVSLHTGVGPIAFYQDGLKIEEREAYHELKKMGFDIQSNEKFIILQKTPDKWQIPLKPHFPIPAKVDEFESKKLDMSYHLPE